MPEEDGKLPGRHALPADTETRVIRRVWMDPARGLVPLRQEFLDPEGKPRMTFEATSVQEISPGLWIATHFEKIVEAIPGFPEAAGRYRTAVEAGEDGELDLLLNDKVTERHPPELPPGPLLSEVDPIFEEHDFD